MFNAQWAASMLSCSEDEATARIKVVQNELEIRDAKKYRRGMDPVRWPELIENGGAMARLRGMARDYAGADPELPRAAAATLSEIEKSFSDYSREKDTGRYGLKMLCAKHGLQMVLCREPLAERILNQHGFRTRRNFIFELVCGCARTKYPHAEEMRAAGVGA